MILVEPQCHNLEHSMVNTLFIKGLLKSSLDYNLILFAEENHLRLVSDNLDSINQISYKSINIPERGSSNARRLIHELKLVTKIFFLTRKHNSSKIIFLSSTPAGIYCIKLLSCFFVNLEVFIILHSIIETIDKKKINPVWDYPFNIIYALSFFRKKNIKYVIFNKFSLQRFEKKYSKLSPFFLTIEFPFEYIRKEVKKPTFLNIENKIIFASIGDFNTRKNSSLFFDLANKITQVNSIFDFWFIGRMNNCNIDVKNVYFVSSDYNLDDESYNHYIKQIDYAVFLFNSDFYRYSVSGTLYDAIFHLKPILAIKSPFFQDFFLKYGNIGYLFDSFDDMLNQIHLLTAQKNSPIYLEQQFNLEKARKDLNDLFLSSFTIF